VAGINAGKVTDITLRPDKRDEPVRVTIVLRTDYELRIPNDSKVILATAGVLGETYVVIEVAGAAGPPVSNHDTLKSVESPEVNYTQMLDKLTEALKNLNCDDVRAPKSKVQDRKH
jgi:ABC-type transporter Mla subunit MlaD